MLSQCAASQASGRHACELIRLPAAFGPCRLTSSSLPFPPFPYAALTSLRLIGALDSATGALTSLGQHLTRMPCDPRIGGLDGTFPAGLYPF